MKRDVNQELIQEIIDAAKNLDKDLSSKIHALISLYEDELQHSQNLIEKNKDILNEREQRNSIDFDAKDVIIEQQSRLAAMGEMIDAVAHQWKQPLNAITMMIEMLTDDFELGSVDKKYINELNESVHLQIDYMVNTLSEFRNFLRPSTKNSNFKINTVVQSVQILMKDELITQNLHLEIDIDESIELFGNKNEFKHLFINLLNNSIDAYNERSIRDRRIYIHGYRQDKDIFIEIEDNAGGIPDRIIDHIFKPNITTKPDGKGTGIGLYMCQQIVSKYNGTISVKNKERGALFTVSFRESTI